MENKKIELADFKKLTVLERVNLVNTYANGTLNLGQIAKMYFNFSNLSAYMPKTEAIWDGNLKRYVYIGAEDKSTKTEEFTAEEVALLKEMLAIYTKQKIVKLNVEELDQKDLCLRSFRCYKPVLNTFAQYCKTNNLNQANALATALIQFMQNDINPKDN